MTQLIEATFGGSPKVDREEKIIRDVRVLGRESKNDGGKRIYSQAALESLLAHYEGIQVNVDHPDRSNPRAERSIADGFGVLHSPRLGDDGVYADLHYLETHALAPVVVERAERMPSSFGLSHNAEGRTARREGRVIVEGVDVVHSVDIVSRPATTRGLFESTETEEDQKMVDKTVMTILAETKKTDPGRSLLLEAVEGGDVAADMAVPVAAEAPAADGIKAAFRAAVMAAFDDESLDAAATVKKIRDILKAQEKITKKTEEVMPEETAAASAEAVPESVRAEIEHLRAQNLLLESGREATPERIAAVAAVPEELRSKLVESWSAPEKKPEKPAFSAPRYTDGSSYSEMVKDGFAKAF